MIRILYFGRLKDSLGCAQEQIQWSVGDSQALLTLLRGRDSHWAEVLAEKNIFRLAINQQIVYQTTTIVDGDEVAILPPVTGG